MALVVGAHPAEGGTPVDHVPYLLPLGFGVSGCLELGLRRSGWGTLFIVSPRWRGPGGS